MDPWLNPPSCADDDMHVDGVERLLRDEDMLTDHDGAPDVERGGLQVLDPSNDIGALPQPTFSGESGDNSLKHDVSVCTSSLFFLSD